MPTGHAVFFISGFRLYGIVGIFYIKYMKITVDGTEYNINLEPCAHWPSSGLSISGLIYTERGIPSGFHLCWFRYIDGVRHSGTYTFAYNKKQTVVFNGKTYRVGYNDRDFIKLYNALETELVTDLLK